MGNEKLVRISKVERFPITIAAYWDFYRLPYTTYDGQPIMDYDGKPIITRKADEYERAYKKYQRAMSE